MFLGQKSLDPESLVEEMTRKGVNRTTTLVEKGREQPVIIYYFHPPANLSVKPKCIRHSLAVREYTPLATKI